jgi:Right handed beta helix region
MNYVFSGRNAFLLACLLLAPRDRAVARPIQNNSGSPTISHPLNASLAAGSDIGAKINTLVAGCAGTYCPIFIPAGAYTFTTPVVLASNVELFGAGQNKTILTYKALHPSAGSSATAAQMTTAVTAGDSTTKVKIHDLQILGTQETVGSPATYNNTQGILLKGTYSTIDKVKVAHHWAYGSPIVIGGSHNTLSNSDVEYGTFCVSLSGSYQTVSKNYISNHYSTASAAEAPAVHYWDGIVSEGLTYALIDGNTVEDNGQSGIYEGGNGSLSAHNKINNNLVQHNWNRGIDNGVTGHASKGNGVLSLTITNNHVIDNLEDNIWLICVQQADVTGNRTEYTSNYPVFFKSKAANTRSGIVVGDLCGPDPQDTTSNISVTGNTVSDYQTSTIGLNFNVKPASIGNKFTGNTNNAQFYVSPHAVLAKNTVQK